MKNETKFSILMLFVSFSAFTFGQQVQYASTNTFEGSIDKLKEITANHAEINVAVSEQANPEAKEDDAPTFTLGGSIDTYFHSTFGHKNAFFGDAHAPSTSFGDLKGFSLGMVNLVATYGGEKVGFTGDFVLGPRGKAAVFGSATGQSIINQLFAYYKVGESITLNMGQFNTFLGYEVISPATNFHYSTSYMFSYGPFNHTGFRADIDLGGGLGAKVALMNPTDLVEFNPVNTYTLGGQLGFSNDNGGAWINVLYGDQDGTLNAEDFAGTPFTSAGNLFQVDLTTGWDLSERFYLGVNTTLQTVDAGEEYTVSGSVQDISGVSSSFMGVAVYPKFTFSDAFALGVRAEYFAVTNGHLDIFGTDANGDGDVMAVTLSANYNLGGLTFIPEFRLDKTSQDSFHKGTSTGDLLPSINLAAVYKF